jgi:hypothetical protein
MRALGLSPMKYTSGEKITPLSPRPQSTSGFCKYERKGLSALKSVDEA